MSALGDSTSTATLAQYRRSHAMSPASHAGAILDFLRLGLSGGNKFVLSDWNLSWTTGLGSRKVLSHAGRLRQLNPRLQVSNFAEPSVPLEAVWQKQLPLLKAWSRASLGQNYPDYVTVFAGANDICGESLAQTTSAKSFLRTYEKILLEILAQSPRSRVLVVPLPPYHQLRNSSEAFLLFFPKLNQCRGLWQMAPLCKSITHSRVEELAALAGRIAEINRRLRAKVAQLRGEFGDRVRLAEHVASRNILPEDLSIDCFHPNFKAQNDLSALSWKSTWWSR